MFFINPWLGARPLGPGLGLSFLLAQQRGRKGARATPEAGRPTGTPSLKCLRVSLPHRRPVLPETTFKEEYGTLMSPPLPSQALCSLPASLLTIFNNQIPSLARCWRLMEDCKGWDKYLMRGGHYQLVAWGVGSCSQREGMGFHVILPCYSFVLFLWIFEELRKQNPNFCTQAWNLTAVQGPGVPWIQFLKWLDPSGKAQYDS